MCYYSCLMLELIIVIITRYSNTVFVADSSPSTKELLPYLVHIAPSWYVVGAALLEPERESQLKLIRKNNHSDAKQCCLHMLEYWMETHPNATWYHLITALRAPGVDLTVVANEIEKNFAGV